MRIKLTRRQRAFTVLGNEVLRDRRLSFTARGILAYLLSLPDGAREDVRTLADKNPGLGRRGVSKALDELIELGYYVRHTVRDQETGQVRTRTYVFDQPLSKDALLPASAGTGDAEVGNAGAFPKENKNPEKEPTRPVALVAGTEPPSGRAEGAPTNETTTASVSADAGRGAALLSRLGGIEPKLALSPADALALAPLAARWLDAGVSELETRSLLTAGLPPVVHSARALLADRLMRKLPAPRTRLDAVAPAASLAECAECRDPLPRGHQTDICAVCAGTSASPVVEATPAVETVANHVAALRSVLRARPTTTTAPG